MVHFQDGNFLQFDNTDLALWEKKKRVTLLWYESNLRQNKISFNMFYVFPLAYHSAGFLWPTLLFFHHFANRERKHVHCTLHMHGASTFAFKFLQINRYMKWRGTWNMFLFLVRWQDFFSNLFVSLATKKVEKKWINSNKFNSIPSWYCANSFVLVHKKITSSSSQSWYNEMIR